MKKKWAIGFVNFKTAVYIKWQLKMLYEFNDPTSFSLLIVDNSAPFEKEALESLTAPYQTRFNNIKIIYNNPEENELARKFGYKGSHPHAHGLTVIRDNCGTPEYILFQDPDFFWSIPGYLDYLESRLQAGDVAVGAPYPDKMGLGHPWFPALYGCAHRFSDIKNFGFYPDMDPEKNKKVVDENSELNPLSYDVGFELRQALSSAEVVNFTSFEQVFVGQLKKFVGIHSFSFMARAYFHKNKLVAFHLFRGSFTTDPTRVNEELGAPADAPEAWRVIREKYGELFYQIMADEMTYQLASLVFVRSENKNTGMPKIVIDRAVVEKSDILRAIVNHFV